MEIEASVVVLQTLSWFYFLNISLFFSVYKFSSFEISISISVSLRQSLVRSNFNPRGRVEEKKRIEDHTLRYRILFSSAFIHCQQNLMRRNISLFSSSIYFPPRSRSKSRFRFPFGKSGLVHVSAPGVSKGEETHRNQRSRSHVSDLVFFRLYPLSPNLMRFPF